MHLKATISSASSDNFLKLDNKIWNNLIEINELHGIESNIEFLHVSTIDIYKNLLKKNLDVK